jgi:hypothetical protein
MMEPGAHKERSEEIAMTAHNEQGPPAQLRDPEIGGGKVNDPWLRPHFDEGTEEGKTSR